MKVLDLGSGGSSAAAQLWPNAEIVRVDVDPEVEPDVVADVRALPADLGKFDHILAAHVLEHLSRADVLPTLEHWVGYLVDGGALHVLVPDIVWAAEEIIAGRMTWAVMAHVYGSQAGEWQEHKMGFTLKLLRAVVYRAGLVVRDARVGPYEIVNTGDDGECERVEARQVYVVGVLPHGNGRSAQE